MTIFVVIDKSFIFRLGLTKVIGDTFESAEIHFADEVSELLESRMQSFDMVIWAIDTLSKMVNVGKAVTQIKEKYSVAGVILYDLYPQAGKIPQYISSGIDGYVTSNSDLLEFAECFRQLRSGKFYITTDAALMVAHNLRRFSGSGPKISVLSKGERVVAEHLCRGTRVSEISRLMDRKVTTISTIKRRIFERLEIENIFQLRDMMRSTV